MYLNPCIKKHFLNPDEISKMEKTVEENCGVCKSLENSADCKLFKKIQETESKNSNDLNEFLNTKIERMERKMEDIESSMDSIRIKKTDNENYEIAGLKVMIEQLLEKIKVMDNNLQKSFSSDCTKNIK